MATTFGITHTFKGGTAEQYDRSIKVVHPNEGKGLPAGQTYHAAGETNDGFVVVALWDSEASWLKFRDETLLPGLAKVDGGLVGPPEEVSFPVHNFASA
jgi:hypothetical protein